MSWKYQYKNLNYQIAKKRKRIQRLEKELSLLCKDVSRSKIQKSTIQSVLQHPTCDILLTIFSQDIVSILLEFDSFHCCNKCFTNQPKLIESCITCNLKRHILYKQTFNVQVCSVETLNENEWSELEQEMLTYVTKYLGLPLEKDSISKPPFFLDIEFDEKTYLPNKVSWKSDPWSELFD